MQSGQPLSAVPFAFLLHSAGWETAHLFASGLGVVALVGVLRFVANGTPLSAPPPVSGRNALRPLWDSLGIGTGVRFLLRARRRIRRLLESAWVSFLSVSLSGDRRLG